MAFSIVVQSKDPSDYLSNFPVEEVTVDSQDEAVEQAEQLVQKYQGQEDSYSIFVVVLDSDASCYVNRLEGVSPTGECWLN